MEVSKGGPLQRKMGSLLFFGIFLRCEKREEEGVQVLGIQVFSGHGTTSPPVTKTGAGHVSLASVPRHPGAQRRVSRPRVGRSRGQPAPGGEILHAAPLPSG